MGIILSLVKMRDRRRKMQKMRPTKSPKTATPKSKRIGKWKIAIRKRKKFRVRMIPKNTPLSPKRQYQQESQVVCRTGLGPTLEHQRLMFVKQSACRDRQEKENQLMMKRRPNRQRQQS